MVSGGWCVPNECAKSVQRGGREWSKRPRNVRYGNPSNKLFVAMIFQ